MQFTTTSLALASVGIVAALVPQNIAVRDTPQICVPTDKANQANSYTYEDETSSCALSGNCETACGTFITSAGSVGFTAEIKSDLLQAMGQQLQKDGQLEISQVGDWTASFPFLLTTAIHNQLIVGEWSEAVNLYDVGSDEIPSTVYFQATGDGYYDVIVATYGA
jgi:hypothetical protein